MMPASLFCDLESPVSRVTGPGQTTNAGSNGSGFEDQRALQLAYELTMLGLADAASNPTTPADPDPSSILPTPFIVPDETRSKKSQNMTECVPVPSSEHVAEIVGRQGNYVFCT